MLYTRQPKKMLIINILDILRKYTDADHRLSQNDIAEILKTEYDMQTDRKSIRRNISDLIEFGYEIEYSEVIRMVPNRKTGELEESSMWSDFYMVREFDDSELRLLIDGLLFSKHIPYSQCRELVEKLEGLSNRYFRSRVKYIRTLPDSMPANRQLFLTIDVLDEAIANGRQVSFHYCTYGTDRQLHEKEDAYGRPRDYIVNPYQMAEVNGKYYLICNYDSHENVANVRLDRIRDIRLLDTPVKPVKKVEGLENGLDLPKHMAEHIYMFSGESEPVTFRFKRYLLNDVMDWFGSDIVFTQESEDEITARVYVNLQAMRRWALQYAMHVRIISPERLAVQVKEDLKEAMENYNINEKEK